MRSGEPYRGYRKAEMRVLFVNDVPTECAGFEPLGLLYLSSVLRSEGHDTKYCPPTRQELGRIIRDWGPALIAISVSTGMHRRCLDAVVATSERHNAFIVLGGSYATFCETCIEAEKIDALCLGEGEGAIVELARSLVEKTDLSSIKNLHVKTSTGIVRNDLRPLIGDLDALPFPDRDLLYRRHPWMAKGKLAYVAASRGCPFDCRYCCNAYFHELYKGKGPRVRKRSVAGLVSEIRELKEVYQKEFVHFTDDLFDFPLPWLEEFRDRYRREVGLPFYCIMRLDVVRDEKIGILADAGCVSMAVAIESGNDAIRRDLLGRSMSKARMLEGLTIIKRHGIRLFVQNMLGLPGESLEQMYETLDFNIRCRPDYAWASMFVPYPNTSLGEQALESGLYNTDPNRFSGFFVASLQKGRLGKKAKRLQKLFALSVEFPLIRRLLGTLLQLPLTRLYEISRKFWKGYCYCRRIFPVRHGVLGSCRLMVALFRRSGM